MTLSTAPPSTNTELDLLVLFGDRAIAEKYGPYIKDYTVLDTTKKIITDIEGYFIAYPDESKVDWVKFSTWFSVLKNSRMKGEQLELYKTIFGNLAGRVSTSAPEVLNHFIKLDHAAQIRQLAQDVIDGKPKARLEDIEGIVSAYTGGISGTGAASKHDEHIVSSDLSELLSCAGRVGGAEWRLEDLNIGVGPLRDGNFIVIAARPETGKTSFVCSEGTFIVPQLDPDRNGIIFNNEEKGEQLKLRVIQSAIGKSIADIEADPAAAEAEYVKLLGSMDRIDVYHSHSISTKDVERQLRKRKYGWIAFNRLDKIRLPQRKGGQSSEVEQLNQVYMWARGIALQYGIVFAVVQADASAEGKRIIWQEQIYGSKTGVQGEADVLITVGKDHDTTHANKRWLNVCKNKLPGGPRSSPSLSHAQWEVGFDRDVGRYRSLVY